MCASEQIYIFLLFQLGKPLNFKVKVVGARGLPANMKKVWKLLTVQCAQN